jgi:enoyl-CoA hydratase/carnithine racemase
MDKNDNPASQDLLKVTDGGDGIQIIEFNRKSKANAFSEELLRQIASALLKAQNDSQIKSVVATGGDKVFAAGGDLQEWEGKEPIELWASKRNEYWRIFNEFPKPLIAAVNGYAYGGGCEFVLQSDIAVCGENASFCLPEITLGFAPGRGGTQRLPIVAGRSAASYMILTGEAITAERALALGLVTEVCAVNETLPRAIEIARSINRHPTEAVQIAKELIKSTYMHLSPGLKYEGRSFEFLKGTESSKALTKKFLERKSAKMEKKHG